jgi:hypothetical protein
VFVFVVAAAARTVILHSDTTVDIVAVIIISRVRIEENCDLTGLKLRTVKIVYSVEQRILFYFLGGVYFTTLSVSHDRNVLPPSSGWKSQRSKQVVSRECFVCFLVLLFDSEDGCSTFLRNVGKLIPDYTPSRPRR